MSFETLMKMREMKRENERERERCTINHCLMFFSFLWNINSFQEGNAICRWQMALHSWKESIFILLILAEIFKRIRIHFKSIEKCLCKSNHYSDVCLPLHAKIRLERRLICVNCHNIFSFHGNTLMKQYLLNTKLMK